MITLGCENDISACLTQTPISTAVDEQENQNVGCVARVTGNISCPEVEVVSRLRHLSRHKNYGKNYHQILLETRNRIDWIGSGSNDPFNALPDVVKGDTDLLAYHWNTVFVNTTTPPGPREQWFPFASQDPALFHAIMLISAAHIASSARSKPQVAFFQHRGEVIRLIRERIKNNNNATNDSTIGAISCLLVTDSMSGHPERTQAHLSALKQLISARGGISRLDTLIMRVVGWADLLASISLSQEPIFRPPHLKDPNFYSYYGPPSLSTTTHTLAFSAQLLNFTSERDLCDLARRILWGLRNLSVMRGRGRISDGLTRNTISYSDRVELLEREAQRLLHESFPNETAIAGRDQFYPNTIFTVFAYATLIHICSSFRDLVPSAITHKLASRLEMSMDISDKNLNILLGTFPELMLWILFLGGGAADRKAKVWFAVTASRILRVKKLENEKDITAAASSFLWPEGYNNYDESACDNLEMANISSVEVESLPSSSSSSFT